MNAGGIRVLVVDDQVEVRELIAEILRESGFAVEEASSPSTAVAMSRDRSFDAIVADVIMPGASGVEMMREIDSSDLAVVFLSGNPTQAVGDNPELEEALFVPKPFASGDLLEALELALLRRDRRRSRDRDGDPSGP